MKVGDIKLKWYIVFLLLVTPTLSGANLQYPGKVLSESTKVYQYDTGSLVNDKGTIYFIYTTVKIPFTNFEAFKGLGYSLKNVVNGDLSNYTSAKSYFITSANEEHPWGSWLLHNGTVYYSQENGLIPIPNWNIFLSNGGKANLIVKANAADLEVLNKNPGIALLSDKDSRVNSLENAGIIQASLLPETASASQTTKVDCTYAEAPAGFHYEGQDGPNTCGKYLVLDTLSLCGVNSSCFSGGNSTSTVATNTIATLPNLPVISGINPATGTVGTVVTLTGMNFTTASNTVVFSPGVIPNISSTVGGTKIQFEIPDFVNPSCYYLKLNCLISASKILAGKHTVSVYNANGESNSVEFEVSEATCPGPILCSPPPEGYTYSGGGQCSCGSLVPITSTEACLVPISCAAPPVGYYYLGGGKCSCGQLVPSGSSAEN